eukprot:Phypoly_transcript_02458.p1 GENE.Phypoly_transcript_02458~~Phypoly_transcript_02458.p1  ORF type:complete len:897 (+),score=111.23 Phypoly_transcript_02458:48-2738(+)
MGDHVGSDQENNARANYYEQASARLNTYIPFASPLNSFGDGQSAYPFAPVVHATSLNEPLIAPQAQAPTLHEQPNTHNAPPENSTTQNAAPTTLTLTNPTNDVPNTTTTNVVTDKFANLSISTSPLQSSVPLESIPLSPELHLPKFGEPEPTTAPLPTGQDSVPNAAPAQEPYSVAKSQPVLLSSSKIPNERSVVNKTHLPFGMIFSPALQLSPPAPQLELAANQSPLRCTHCGAYINRYCSIDRSYDAWTCILCHHKNSARGSYTLTGSYPELVKHIYEFVQTTDILGTTIESKQVFIFVIDANITQSDTQGIRESILATIASLPPNAQIGILTFARVVSVYKLTHIAPVSADAIPGNASLEEFERSQLRDKRDMFIVDIEHARRHLSSVLHCIVSSAPQDTRRGVKSNTKKAHAPEPRRATGAAIEVALALSAEQGVADNPAGHVIVFTNGGPSYGPGALPLNDTEVEGSHQLEHAHEFFKNLGQKAARTNTSVTFLCGGAANFHTPTLHTVCLPSGGSLLLLRDFMNSSLHSNLQLITTRCTGRNGIFDVRTSESVQLTRIIGPSSPIPKFDPEGEIPTEGTNTCYMASVIPTQSFSIFYEPVEDIVADYVYFQFVTRYTTHDNTRIVRVVTRRVGTTGNIKTFLSSLDLDVSFVLLSKRLVLSARKGLDSDDVTRELDKSFKDILQAFGDRSARTHRYEFDTEILQKLPRKLFSTRRGPLLGPILQHKDDIDQVRCLFLNANFDDSLRMVDPKMYEIQTGEWIEVPLTTLALQSKNILYLDHHTQILVWSGQDAVGPQFDHIRDLALREAHNVSSTRFPQPQIMLFNEGSSMSRFLLCRLGPDHKDDLNDQIAIYPQLARLPPAERSALLAKFHYTDDPSFSQYFRLLTSSF